MATAPLLNLATWVPILDGDPEARAIYEQHYSSKKSLATRLSRGAVLFLGPGYKLVLSTPCRRALFAWRKALFRADRQKGVECTIFSNKGAGLSSELIREADAIADGRWPGERHFTFVDAEATEDRRSSNARPGECFIRADWQPCGVTASGLHVLERSPHPRKARHD